MGNTRTNRSRRFAQRVWDEEGGYWYAPNLKNHGTWNGYNNWYCRCPPCTDANTSKVTASRRAHDYEEEDDEELAVAARQ